MSDRGSNKAYRSEVAAPNTPAVPVHDGRAGAGCGPSLPWPVQPEKKALVPWAATALAMRFRAWT